jgi:hypothetical protein
MQNEIERIREMQESKLVEDNRTLEEVIREVAEEEGMSYEQTLALFKKGMKDAHGILNRKKPTAQQKAKAKKKKQMAKASKKRNR